MSVANDLGMRFVRHVLMIVLWFVLPPIGCSRNAGPEVVSPRADPDLLAFPTALRLCTRAEGESPSFTFIHADSSIERETTVVYDTTGGPRLLIAQALTDRPDRTFASYVVIVNFESGKSTRGVLESDTAGGLATRVPSFDPDSIPGFTKLSGADYARARRFAEWLWQRRCGRAAFLDQFGHAVPLRDVRPLRVSGKGKGKWRLGKWFDAPLPDHIVAYFEP